MTDAMARVAWSEGMLLRPQHFQQQDRFLYHAARLRHFHLEPYGYGVSELELDEQQLSLGQLGVVSVSGIFPDGMPFSLDENDGLMLDVPADTRDEVVYLALPSERQSGTNIAGEGDGAVARFVIRDASLADEALAEHEPETVGLARLNPCLRLGREDMAGYVAIPVARIIEVANEKEVRLDRHFIPPCLDVGRIPALTSLINETLAMIRQRGEALAGRMQKGNQQSKTLFDIMMLQTLNRWQPALEHCAESPGVHPEELYRTLVTLAGELSTFTRNEKRPPELPRYRHESLTETFGDLGAVLSQSLSTVLEETAVALKLEEADYGIRVAPLNDKSLLENAQLVLAVRTDLSTEEVRRRLPAQIKLGPVEHIRELVNSHLPGIPVSALPVAPRQIPYHAGYHYFMLESGGERWRQLQHSGGLAVHVSGNYPGLELELWAIRR